MSDLQDMTASSRRHDEAVLANALALQERTQELRQLGAELVDMLRTAAADVECGRPVAAVGDRLNTWSAAVAEHLSKVTAIVNADDLAALSQGLTEVISRAQEEDQKRRDALHGANILRAQGLHHLVPGMLRAQGFGSLEELQATVSAADAGNDRGEDQDGRGTSDEGPGGAGTTAGPASPPTERSQPHPAESDDDAELDTDAETVAKAGTELAADTEAQAGTELAADTDTDGKDSGTSVRDGPEPSQALPADDEWISFPWDIGTPPLLASLISAGREALAVCVAEAAEETMLRKRLLRFFCAAYACAPTSLELQFPELTPTEADVDQMSPDESRVLVASALRIGLALGYSPVGLPALIDRAELAADGRRAIVDAAAEAVQRGYRRQAGLTVQKHADLPRQWAAFEVDAPELQKALARRRINLQRASNVLHHMVRQDQPVGEILGLVAELAAQGMSPATSDSTADEAKWSKVERMAAELATPAKRGRLIEQADQAVSTGPQLRRHIIAGARARLDDSVREVAELLRRFIAVRSAIRLSSNAADLETADELFRAIALRGRRADVRSVGDAALERLVDWVQGDATTEGAGSLDDLLHTELEPLYEIPRDHSGIPTRPPDLAEARELIHGRDPVAVLKGYLRAGNVAAARGIIAADDRADSSALDDEVLRGTREAEQRHAEALAAIDRTAARLRAVYEDEAARDLTVRADPLRVPPEGRFDLTIGPLRVLASDGAARLQAFCDDLRRRTESSSCGAADKRRILELIDHENEILAVEFLTMAEADLPLPAFEEQHGDDFSEFFPALVKAAVAASLNGKDVIDAVRRVAGAETAPANRQLADGLKAWRDLKTNKRASDDRFRPSVANVLRMLGLVPRPQSWLQELSKTHRAGYATFKVRATPVDRSYVPSLGTQAHDTYDLTIVWDLVTPTRLMDFIEERRRTEANIILYFGVLDPAQRLMLRRLTSRGGKGFSPLVVDEPVAAWLSTRPEPGWRFTQRVTLPFTTLNPYTPFAGGEVPDEVFVGRESERQAIESPTGSMFVYGGRQLGKSALLRRVERLFTEPMPAHDTGPWIPRTGHVAVYVDLKATSIGEAQEPAALWAVLAQRLKDAHVLSPKIGRAVGPDVVTRQLSQWLNADDANRLLLLLDEADNFLTADSQASRSGRGPEFPELQRLKDLMGSSERRFKPVFAGLHQVQRFHDTSNTPVAHGGDDILIGPLRSMDAYRLVVDPMNALGYKFSSPELVWRLLLFTNYQASLVQIVCEALVREMQGRQLADKGGRILITSADVESVYAKREVKDLIAQRFRWTINLDNRYRVIALVVAFRSLDSEPGEAFSVEELHDECEVFWPTGFSRGVLTNKEFRRYLEEMVGLGVLHRQNEQYGLRSPNIIGLLGTRESLDQELSEAQGHLELQYEYNPTMNRRIMGQSTELWAPRSPLTDHDIASLLGSGGRSKAVQIVTGSEALTVDRVARVIEDVAAERQIACAVVRAEEIDAAISGVRTRRHVVVDVSGDEGTKVDLAALSTKLGSLHHVTAIVVVGPSVLPFPPGFASASDVVSTRRWSIEGLRSWHESPFHTPELRARLHRVTSGWPRLVEETMREISDGKSPEDALSRIVERLSSPDFARTHLLTCGIDLDLAKKWAMWQWQTGADGLAEALPASLSDLSEALEADAGQIIERLQALDLVESTDEGWVLDRAVLNAAVALQE